MEWIKKLYVYIFATVGLVLLVIGGVQIISLGLRSYVFTKADMYYAYPEAQVQKDASSTAPDPKAMEEFQEKNLQSQRQRQASTALAFIIVGIPLFGYHFRIIRKDMSRA